MFAYALTIFSGAFLLFQVQPLMGKFILPWFGGGPGVWTTCLLFFQIVLLAGYAYAHASTRWLKPRAQVVVHLGLLVAALVFSRIVPGDGWKPGPGGNPTLQILTLLTVCLAIPYFALSSTGPLVQQWFSRTNPGISPYRLYALSNVGSLLALVSYPFYFENHFTRRAQAGMWAWGLAAYAVCCAFCALKIWNTNETPDAEPQTRAAPPDQSSPPSLLNRMLWLLLPACASALLLATTNKMCQDIAVIPFLWVLPLALYLLSFIISFDNPRWYARFPFTLALIVSLIGIIATLFEGIDASVHKQIAIYSSGLFFCCMVCHGELYRLRPDPRHLTGFYLMISAGGALGGLFVAVVSPLVFKDYYELHWALLMIAVLFVIICVKEAARGALFSEPATESDVGAWLACILPLAAIGFFDWYLSHSRPQVDWVFNSFLPNLFGSHGFPHNQFEWLKGWLTRSGISTGSWFVVLRVAVWLLVLVLLVLWCARKKLPRYSYASLIACVCLAVGAFASGAALWRQAAKSDDDRVYTSRNFYGVFNIYEESRTDPKEHRFRLQHGRITHGLQFTDEEQSSWPTTYYGENSGVGLAIHALPAGDRRLGLVGLGTGTLAAYGRSGDYLRIYEINPEAKHLATSWFTYVTNCRARVEIVMGDARLSLEREDSQKFDLLALDAFSGDAIPVHLLTKEAFDIYGRHLKPDGILAVHISNHYLDLEPVVVNLARRFDYQLAAIDHEEGEEDAWDYSSTWILLSHSQSIIESPAISGAAYSVKTNFASVPLWTDDFTSVFQILKK